MKKFHINSLHNNLAGLINTIYNILSVKVIYSCFLLVKNVSRDSGEILLSPWQRS